MNILIKDPLRLSVELSSNGENTVLYDQCGIPNIMKIYPATKMVDIDPSVSKVYAQRIISTTAIRFYIKEYDYYKYYITQPIDLGLIYNPEEVDLTALGECTVSAINRELLVSGVYAYHIDVECENAHGITLNSYDCYEDGTHNGYLRSAGSDYAVDEYHRAFYYGNDNPDTICDLFIGKYRSLWNGYSGDVSYLASLPKHRNGSWAYISDTDMNPIGFGSYNSFTASVRTAKGHGWSLLDCYANDFINMTLVKDPRLELFSLNKYTSNNITNNGLDSGLCDLFNYDIGEFVAGPYTEFNTTSGIGIKNLSQIENYYPTGDSSEENPYTYFTNSPYGSDWRIYRRSTTNDLVAVDEKVYFNLDNTIITSEWTNLNTASQMRAALNIGIDPRRILMGLGPVNSVKYGAGVFELDCTDAASGEYLFFSRKQINKYPVGGTLGTGDNYILPSELRIMDGVFSKNLNTAMRLIYRSPKTIV